MSLRLFSRAGLSLFLALSLAACAQTVIYEKASSYNNIIVTETLGLRTLLSRDTGRQSVVAGRSDHLELAYSRVALVGGL
jgi:hypothetical protein